MTNGEKGHNWRFAALPVLVLDQPLWHVYPSFLSDGTPISPTQFNPRSTARLAVPGLAMYYAATTPECVLWEVPPLRTVLGDPQHRIALHSTQFARQRLARVQPRRPLRLLNLHGPALRQLAGDDDTLNQLHHALQTHEHTDTHALAAALLKEALHRKVSVDGLIWRSKQLNTDHDRVALLYAPPASAADLHSVDPGTALDDNAAGWHLIDQALARCGYRRLTADSDLAEDDL